MSTAAVTKSETTAVNCQAIIQFIKTDTIIINNILSLLNIMNKMLFVRPLVFLYSKVNCYTNFINKFLHNSFVSLQSMLKSKSYKWFTDKLKNITMH